MRANKTEQTVFDAVTVPRPRPSSVDLRTEHRESIDEDDDDGAFYSALTFAEGNFVAAQQDMLLRYLDCDYRGAQAMARALVHAYPSNSLAAAIIDECARAIDQNRRLLAARLRLVADERFVRHLSLDAVTLRILRALDGTTTLRTILVSAGVRAEDVLDALRALLARGVVTAV